MEMGFLFKKVFYCEFNECARKCLITCLGFFQGSQGHGESRRKEFEAWLFKQNELLSEILSAKESAHSSKEVNIKHEKLKVSSFEHQN